MASFRTLAFLLLAFVTGCGAPAGPDTASPAPIAAPKPPDLPSWNEGPARTALVDFVKAVTTEGSNDFVPIPQRIATFDNDGTLWSEQPLYFQFLFVMARVRAMAADHPEWKTTQPFKAALEGDQKALAAAGEKGLLQLMMATHAGVTVEEFDGIVTDWMKTARHPTTGLPYNQMTYQPMVEVLTYLRANGFKTFIVSGAASSSCGRGSSRRMAFRPNKSSAAAAS